MAAPPLPPSDSPTAAPAADAVDAGGEDGAGGDSEAGDGPPPLPAGTWIGRYQIVAPLGVGGMGVVYRARDPELGREVALKLLAGDGAPGESHGHTRLLREAQALAQLSHPNVIAVFDVGRYADRGVFIAMELVAGRALDAWLATPRSWREVVHVFAEVAKGLAAAHAVGLVHRDVKPANIMVGDDARVRVLDFGLARASGLELPAPGASAHHVDEDPTVGHTPRRARATLHPSLATPTPTPTPTPRDPAARATASSRSSPSLLGASLTLAGAVVGTPPYMAPEQHLGEACDARSDQFSFCVAFHQALYGERPFGGATYEQLRDNMVQGRLLPPPAAARVPAWIRAIVARGLATQPDRRWPSMGALLEALGRDPVARRARRLRLGLVTAAALVAALAVGRVIHVAAGRAARCAGGPARLHGVWDGERRAQVEAAFAATGTRYGEQVFRAVAAVFDGYAQSWTAMERQACEATRVQATQSAELFDLRMACLDDRLRQWQARVDVLAHADRATVEHALAAAQSLQPVAACGDVAALRAAVPLPTDPAARARLSSLRGRIAAAQAAVEAGRYAEARRTLPAILDEARASDYHPVAAEALWVQAELAERTDDYAGAAAELKELTARAESTRIDELAALAWIDQVWIVGMRLGKLPEARELARTAAAKIERLGGDPRLQARLESHLGLVETADGHTAAARRHVERALQLQRRVLRPDDPALAESLRVLGDIAVMESRPDEGIARYREALAQLTATLGPDHPANAWVTSNLAAALRLKGQLDDALAAYDRARALTLASSGPDDAILATIALNTGMIDVELGRLDAAADEYQQALTIWTRAIGPTHPNVGSVHLLRGQLAIKRHRLDEARRELGLARDIWSHAFGADHPSVAEAIIGFGDLALAEGASGEAVTAYQRAVRIQEKALGASYPDLATPLTSMGLAELQRSGAARALPPLERALQLREATAGDPLELARTRFALARALRANGREPARATALATAAAAAYRGKPGAEPAAQLAAIATFLK